MKILNLILVFILGFVLGHSLTPLIADNEGMRDLCPFVLKDHRDPDELFIKFLNSKYRITIEEREGQANK